MQSGFIDSEDLLRKYASNLHANEIMLLAYYIAAVNIETAYAEIAGDYEPFEGIVLTDTFQASEASDRKDTAFFPRNNARIERQLGLKSKSSSATHHGLGGKKDTRTITPINTIRHWIRNRQQLYCVFRLKGIENSLYDPYVRAIRWASDRIRAGEGRYRWICHQQRFPRRQEASTASAKRWKRSSIRSTSTICVETHAPPGISGGGKETAYSTRVAGQVWPYCCW